MAMDRKLARRGAEKRLVSHGDLRLSREPIL